jgi:antitoxin HigA-1
MGSARPLPPAHPGEILFDEYLVPMSLSGGVLATSIGVSHARIYELVSGKRDITADTALRLARYFGNTPLFWMNLQANYELAKAIDLAAEELEKIVPLAEAHRW